MTDRQNMKAIGTRVLDDIVTLAKDAGTLIAEVCEHIYASIKTALVKRSDAESAAD